MSAIDITPVINAVVVYVAPIVGAIVAAGAAYLVALIGKLAKKHGVNLDLQIDAKHREALQSAATNLAGQLIVTGAAKLDPSGEIHLDNAMVAHVAQALIDRVPEAAAHFGITPDKARALIIEKLGLSSTEAVPAKVPAQA